jgi:hypothetical protein
MSSVTFRAITTFIRQPSYSIVFVGREVERMTLFDVNLF